MSDQNSFDSRMRKQRELIIDQLSERFSDDTLDLQEFERRVRLAHMATAPAALEELVRDLEPAPIVQQAPVQPVQPAAVMVSSAPRALAPARRRSKVLAAIMSGIDRRGQWRVAENTWVFACMGGVQLDFREVELPKGTTTVRIVALMGGVEIIVPPQLAVQSDGVGIMGGFASVDRAPLTPSPDEPVLEVTGVAIMGGFEIKTRPRGELGRRGRGHRFDGREHWRKRLPPGE